MKEYVDELPKSCGDCVFCKQTEYYYYCDKLHTKLAYINKEKECPLQSLAEHDKQVRKEVCEEIREKVKNFNKVYLYPDYTKSDAIECILDDIKEILDQTQGDKKCR